jgi:RNA polymerase sigma factor (sigma-70 family)
MTERMQTNLGSGEDHTTAAHTRLVCEFESLRRRLVGLARFRYRLAREDCEEIAADALLAWYQELCRRDGVRVDAAYLVVVLHNRALDHKKAMSRAKRGASEVVPMHSVDRLGVDPQIDALVAEREELRDLAELAKDVLSRQEIEILVLSRLDVPRAEIGERYGLSVRCVERWLERAQRKLDEGREAMEERGRCAMLALTISDIKTGRIGPDHPRYQRGKEHLDRCWRCCGSTPIEAPEAA